MQMKQTSIFQQLIYNIILPVVFALLILGFFNFRNTRVMLRESRETRNFLISDELVQVLRFQDITLQLVENNLNPMLEELSNEIVIKHLVTTKNIEKVDLKALRKSFNLDPKMYDFYVIDTNGVIVNTTFDKD